MPFVSDLDDLDRLQVKTGPGTVHDRFFQIVRETCDELRESDFPLSALTRFGIDINWGSLEIFDFLTRIDEEFGPFGGKRFRPTWWAAATQEFAFFRELREFLSNHCPEYLTKRTLTLGHIILFLEHRKQA